MPLDKKNQSAIRPEVKLTIEKNPDGSVDIAQDVAPAVSIEFPKNGEVSIEDLLAKLAAGLNKSYDHYVKDLDKDKDGKVTHADFDNRLKPDVEVLSREEFFEMAKKSMENLRKKDTNHNGKLSEAEFLKPADLPQPKNLPFDPSRAV